MKEEAARVFDNSKLEEFFKEYGNLLIKYNINHIDTNYRFKIDNKCYSVIENLLWECEGTELVGVEFEYVRFSKPEKLKILKNANERR